MKIVLISFFNSANIGDLLIARSLEELAQRFGNVIRISYGASRFEYSDDGMVDAPRSLGRSRDLAAWRLRLRRRARAIASWVTIDGPMDRMRFCRAADHRRITDLIRTSDAVLIGGGNMLFDVDRYSRSASEFEYFVNLAKRERRAVFGVAIGVGPFATKRQQNAAMKALHRCDYLTFRDQRSLGMYQAKWGPERKAHLTADPVLALEPMAIGHKGAQGNICINLVDYRLAGGTSQEHLSIRSRFLGLIEQLLEVTDREILLFSTDRADYEAILDLAARGASDRCRVVSVRSFADLLEVYSKADLVIACRMHALIVAYTQRIPFIGFSWQPKLDSFFDLIDQKEGVFPLLGTDDVQDVIRLALSKLSDGDGERRQIEHSHGRIVDLLRINEQILERLKGAWASSSLQAGPVNGMFRGGHERK